MLWIQWGNVKEGRMTEYQTWTKKNEGTFSKHMPPGWRYRGTHGSVLGFGRHDVALMLEADRYGDFDVLREWKDETFSRLFEEMQDFFLPGSGEATLLREIGDLRISEPKKTKK